MRRIESFEDQKNGVVTYELADRQRVRLSARAVAEIGAAAVLRHSGLGHLVPTERVPVMQSGRRIGTLAPDFDPLAIRSKSFLYDPRPGDFRREGDVWVATPTLGFRDLECIPGFVRELAGS